MPKPGEPTRHVEVERKFDVGDETVTPSFDGLFAVTRAHRLPTQNLEAIYFDTAANDLAAKKITLRRRTGGPDAGWHLKLPAGPEARTEVRAPLGTGTGATDVPEALLDVVLAIVRDRPLAPAARISTRREVTVIHGIDDVALAEFCDDQVSAVRINPVDAGPGEETPEETPGEETHWREWELELIDPGAENPAGLLDRLGNRLLDAGAGPAGHGSKLAKVLGDSVLASAEPPSDPVHRAVAEQVELMLVWDRAVRADADDAVHQMRVATRQIRSLLQASEDAFGLTDDAWVLGELRELAAVLGIARDAEVLADRYRSALDALPAELIRGPVRERLVDGARRRYQAGLARSLKAMRSPRYFRLLDALENLAVTRPPAAEDARPPADISSSYRRLVKASRATKAATQADRDDALHRIRKAAKRLRYVAAATGEVRVSQRSKTIQALLGDHQDSVVSRTHLIQQADAAHAAGEDTFTYGVLYRGEDELARTCRDQLDGALRELRRTVGRAR
jgi:CHAD domain-containing protein